MPAKSRTSQCSVPSKYPSLNSREAVPISFVLSAEGTKCPALVILNFLAAASEAPVKKSMLVELED